MKEIFDLWLEGIKIILSYLPIGIMLIVVTYMLFFMMDLGACIIGLAEGELIICKHFLPKKIYNILNKFINGK